MSGATGGSPEMTGRRPANSLPNWRPRMRDVRSYRPPRVYAWQYALLRVLLAGIFLLTTVAPRFGTLWHTHEHGREEHTHQHLFTAPEAHTHDHPFGQHPHHHEDIEPVTLSESEDADLHWHAFANSLPVGTVDPLLFFLVWCAVFLLVDDCISYWSRRILFTSARAPPG
jgi:hypothetical protein